MKVENFSSFESEVLSQINQGVNTFETLLDKVNFGEKTLSDTIEELITRNILKLDVKSKRYEYCSPIENNEMVILDGNILLPTTIIKVPEKGIMYVTRGSWYEFPIDFDIRRIIWNVKISGKNNSTLVDMIRTSVLKEKKTKIKHNVEYDSIKNKVLPYCKDYDFIINAVGDEATDITIRFKIYFNKNNPLAPIFKGFRVNSVISTKELINELRKNVSERNYENIKINKIYNASDFFFKGNSLPLSLESNILKYITIDSLKKNDYRITIYSINGNDGIIQKIDTETFDTADEILLKLNEKIKGLPGLILDVCGFLIEEE